MVILAGPLTPEVVTVVVASIPSFPPFLVVVVVRIATVEPPMVVTVVVSSRRVVGLLASSDVFSDQFFYVITISVVLGHSEKLSDHGRPFTE